MNDAGFKRPANPIFDKPKRYRGLVVPKDAELGDLIEVSNGDRTNGQVHSVPDIATFGVGVDCGRPCHSQNLPARTLRVESVTHLVTAVVTEMVTGTLSLGAN